MRKRWWFLALELFLALALFIDAYIVLTETLKHLFYRRLARSE